MALKEGPVNAEGEPPTRTPREVVERLGQKMLELGGGANRRRAAAEASRVLILRSTPSAREAITPRNEQGEPPTRSPQERAERLAEKQRRQRGSANRRRIAAKIVAS